MQDDRQTESQFCSQRQSAGVSLFKKHKISNSSRVRPLSAHLPSSSLVPPCVFKRAFTAASAASCPRGTAVFVLMAGSHPLFFICSRFADLTFCCPLLYVPIMTGGRWRGLCIPLGSHVGKKYSLTAACCSFKTHRTKMLTWQRQSEVTCWEFKREGKKKRRHDCHFLFLKCTWGEMCECISSGWWRGIKKKISQGQERALRNWE